MPGFHTILSAEKINNKPDFRDNLLEKNFKLEIFNQTPETLMAVSYHDGYPFSQWRNGNNQIILEGLIYNLSAKKIKEKLNKIATEHTKGGRFRRLVKDFVDHADGDFIVQILNNKKNQYLAFNDYLGRLPLYYSCQGNFCVLSKEIKTLLNFMPRIELNNFGLVEYLIYEYTLGNKTIFKDIYRFNPAQMITIDFTDKKMIWKVSNSTEFNYLLKNLFKTKKESIEYLKKNFLEATKNRVNTLKRNGYQIISDLSGGYDSRAILAALNKFTDQVTFVTYEYVRDESPIAQKIFEELGSIGHYKKLKFNNKFNFKGIEKLVYKTSGLVNYYTTAVCYKEVERLKSQFPHKAVRFTGLGGEFIRHPFKYFYRSIYNTLAGNFYSFVPLKTACQITNTSAKEYKDELKKYLSSYPEKNHQNQIKRFYYEYYNHYVGLAAEDRERIHFWTVQPLWSLKFIRTIFNRVPLEWVSFSYYTEFLKAIDPRLLKVPIFGSSVNLGSKWSIFLNETSYNIKQKFIFFLLLFKLPSKLPKLVNLYRVKILRRRWKKRHSQVLLEGDRKIKEYFASVPKLRQIFNLGAVQENLYGVQAVRLLTLLMYFKEIERQYSKKFLVKE